MPLRKFMLLDGTAAVITVWLWVSVGWWIGPHADLWMPFLDDLRFVLLVAGVAAVSAGVFAMKLRRSKPHPALGDLTQSGVPNHTGPRSF